LVTSQDIKSAIQFYLRNTTEEITIKDGVGISNLRKKGLFRTIDVSITMQESSPLEKNSKQKIELFLKEVLEKQSVMNIPFQITIN
jgi:3-deoxy-D-manno-octulosonate 8-phosphate phosphatase KdsC-like HAD superfamily phosphatase